MTTEQDAKSKVHLRLLGRSIGLPSEAREVIEIVWKAAAEFFQAHEKMPSWIQYDPVTDTLTIHGKKYAASLFGNSGFLGNAGDILRIEQGSDDVVKVTKIEPEQADKFATGGLRKNYIPPIPIRTGLGQNPMKPVPPVPSVGGHAQRHKPMKLIIGFNQVLNRKFREVMYSVINDFIEKDDAKALFLENVTFVAEIGDTKQLNVHWNKDQAIIASAPDVGIYEGPDWPLYELDSVIEESKAGIPFDQTSLRTLIRVHEALSKAYNDKQSIEVREILVSAHNAFVALSGLTQNSTALHLIKEQCRQLNGALAKHGGTS